MNPRVWLNLFMLVLVIALGVFIINSGDEEITKLSDIDKQSIESIEIRHRDRTIVLQKREHGWRMTSPIDIDANDFRIDSVLNLVNAPSSASYPVEEIDLSSYQLDAPRTSILFSDGAKDTRFEFGSANPINRMRYIRVAQHMHLIEDYLYPLVSSQTGTLISQQLLPDDIAIIGLKIPGYRFSLDDIQWQAVPASPELDSDDIVALIDNWASAQAFGVHDFVERETLGEVRVRYMISGVEAVSDFTVTDIDPWLILANPDLGIEYHLDISHYDSLFNPTSTEEQAILDTEQGLLAE